MITFIWVESIRSSLHKKLAAYPIQSYVLIQHVALRELSFLRVVSFSSLQLLSNDSQMRF